MLLEANLEDLLTLHQSIYAYVYAEPKYLHRANKIAPIKFWAPFLMDSLYTEEHKYKSIQVNIK